MGKTIVCAILVYMSLSQIVSFSPLEVNALKKQLLEKYDKSTNPVTNASTIDVNIAFLIQTIGNLDVTSEKLTTVLISYITWTDELVQWNETESGIVNITIDPTTVWVPEVKIFNQHYDKSNDDGDRLKMPVLYQPNGTANYVELITAETDCDLDTWHFPFDHHICPIKFVANKWNVKLIPQFQKFMLEYYEPDGSWDVIDARIGEFENIVTINITFVRKPAFIVVNLVLPITTLTLLSPVVFLLPNQPGERVAFSITTLLAISVYMTIVSDHLPNKSNPMPLLSSMMLISYIMTAAIIVVVIINARIYRTYKRPLPRTMICFYTVTRCIFCLCKQNETNIKQNEDWDEEKERHSKNKEIRASVKRQDRDAVRWKDVSWAIDIVFMVLLYLVDGLLILVFLVVIYSEDARSHPNI